ncbi:carbohydrate porin [Pseudomonas fluorescens]|uniref:carbohydrate porin n=1 Tax=Pseudomonas fluorescens TaxID=294 RepID=UPI0011AF13C4
MSELSAASSVRGKLLSSRFGQEKAFGWKGAEFKLAITDRNGQNISNDRMGDPRIGTLSSSQEVWGRGHRT